PEVMTPPARVNQARKPRLIPTGVVVVGSLASALLGLAGATEIIGNTVRLGEQSVVSHSPWRLPRTLDWGDVKEVTYSGRGDAISIRGVDGTRIKVSFMLSGMGTLYDELDSRFDPSVFWQTLPLFEAVGIRPLPDIGSFKTNTEGPENPGRAGGERGGE
ncbi:MAG: hypothetical protein LC745_11650, partial [Planctomycetia bacterium]|nr:hypothetical protein [Planctomycetia bacterium]